MLLLWRWRIVGKLPNIPKYVLIVAPHETAWEVPLGWAVGKIQNPPPYKFLMKIEISRYPFIGWLMGKMGGVTVDRKNEYHERGTKPNRIKEMIEFLTTSKTGVVAIAPEGTRKVTDKREKKWFHGFYTIALRSNVPIVMGLFDHNKKLMIISNPYYLTGYVSQDLEIIRKWYNDNRPDYNPIMHIEDFIKKLNEDYVKAP